MTKPILCKENHECIIQLESDIYKRLKEFTAATGLVVGTIDLCILENRNNINTLKRVEVHNLSVGE